MERNSFILYKSQCEIIANLEGELRLKVFDSVLNFAFKNEIPDKKDQLFFALFSIFKDQIERDSLKYTEKCVKRAEAGKKGGLAKASNTKQHLANLAYNDNYNDNYNVNENDNENEIYLSPSPEVLEKEISPLIPKPVKNQINYPQDFESFWTAYQHKGSKKPALAQWLKLNPDQKQKSIEKLPEYFLERPEISFRKDAERYLRDMVWEKYSSINLNAFSIPQNVKTGNANGRNLPDKKTWAEFQEFCNARGMEWTREIDIRLAYTEVPFDCWGKAYLTIFLENFRKQTLQGKEA